MASSSWREASPYWTEANRRKVIQAVVRQVHEMEVA